MTGISHLLPRQSGWFCPGSTPRQSIPQTLSITGVQPCPDTPGGQTWIPLGAAQPHCTSPAYRRVSGTDEGGHQRRSALQYPPMPRLPAVALRTDRGGHQTSGSLDRTGSTEVMLSAYQRQLLSSAQPPAGTVMQARGQALALTRAETVTRH